MKKTVLAFSRVSPEMAERLAQDFNVIVPNPKQGDINAQFEEALPHSHGLIGAGRKLGREQLQNATQLEVVSSISVGYDNYDVGYLSERGILLTNTPDVLTESTADLGFSLIMSSARRVAELDAYTKAGQWTRSIEAPHFGTDVHGKTLGIVGMGNIGAAIARRGRLGFNMPILYSGNSRKSELEQELGAQFRSLDQLLAEADFVCLVVPLSEKTRHLIGRRELSLMKPGAILVNIARGPIVDEPALIEALQNGTIRGAGLDVYEKEPLSESPLFQLKNAVTLPHVGSATTETRQAMADRAYNNLRSALLGERPQDLVNPQVWKG
ncbi:D-isomer specific 2-hydroxyacid dehydrogenase family protein [Pseudomonas syringae pv. actinidiae ICMP 19071]|uniref:D-isomer specific 2-hydroxyacid dehydrogenase protein n=1 Tax=Pseudomonas syringae pv. ribicola TaxID=55398 RepID=A0A3M2VYL6_PSESI|nr:MULTISPECIES: D-glycerate dehydrogenase [Pseudomonas syringae group]EPM54500.1 D-isomer specific 2-hydroxyacid dehydrogenase family protein [Pseudomonas syringae pv. actinidiae ICMP 19071]EPM74602.1 D-isomer specific 2-hydroxyacid dehydrogenase family protein [Pseudomonas syringae pv. actinidiae ICMP 19072]MCR8719714.1 D-glycerate dehydrogenase [Pseudomonas syringae]OSN60816.1 Glyoxylate/hydroxypyruvate reductase B [Pseudomonas syringae pv. actinidiae]OSN70595.1 Glyoxylate/hydroxypyruvate r